MPKEAKVLEKIDQIKQAQVGAICIKHSGAPIPSGMKVPEWQRHLFHAWESGFQTGLAEIEDSSKVFVNKERREQVAAQVSRIGLESQVDIEVLLQCWTAGLLSARDALGIHTPTNPGESRLDQVRIDDA